MLELADFDAQHEEIQDMKWRLDGRRRWYAVVTFVLAVVLPAIITTQLKWSLFVAAAFIVWFLFVMIWLSPWLPSLYPTTRSRYDTTLALEIRILRSAELLAGGVLCDWMGIDGDITYDHRSMRVRATFGPKGETLTIYFVGKLIACYHGPNGAHETFVDHHDLRAWASNYRPA